MPPEMDANARKARIATLRTAIKEAKSIVRSLGAYAHCVGVVQRLVDIYDPALVTDLDIKPIGDFHELRLKGHLLGRTNLRIYFAVRPALNEVVVLKAYKKEDDHRTPQHVLEVLEDRLSDYVSGRIATANLLMYEGR